MNIETLGFWICLGFEIWSLWTYFLELCLVHGESVWMEDKLLKESFWERFCPDRYYNSIFDIDLEELKKMHIQSLLVDLDNTLVAKGEKKVPERLHSWLKILSEGGVRVCVVSNSLAGRARDIAEEIETPVVAMAGKPMKQAFEKGVRLLGTTEEATAVVGDQLFTDILGGNACGMHTILVAPISAKEPLRTRVLRWFERIIFKKITRQGLFKDGRKVNKG